MMHRCIKTFWWSCKLILLSLILGFGISERALAQYFPIHATVQWPAPQSPYLADYTTAGRDRLIVTLLNRDQQQPLLFAKLRLQLKSGAFTAKNREEVAYPMLELNTGVPFRLTSIDLAPYLQPQNLQTNGNLRNGQLPTGYAEISVQVIDYYTGRPLSDWHTARAYLDVKKPPFLNLPEQDAQVALRDPLFIRFQWTPRHQGLSGTEYEFVLKELPDNGVAPQSAFAYGQEIYRTHTRSTSLSYTHLEPLLFPNRRYAWQVRALAREGMNEVGMFEHGGYSEISWFTLNDQCDAPRGLKAQPRFAKVDLSWSKVIGTTGYIVECRPKTKLNVYEWAQTEVAGEQLTLAQLKPGWTYEWRVGTRCTGNRPVFSEVREFTLSKYNENLLADCGKEPIRSDLAKEPHLGIRAGDVVTIGGDYPMTITEVTPLGDGWYAGKGKTRLKTIIDAPIAVRFDRLRINVDKYQIDGTVEASYDEGKGKIANTDYIDDGGKDLRPATLRIREQKLGFSLPESPRFFLKRPTNSSESGRFQLETQDAEGNPQTIQLELPEGADYKSIFPMTVTDAEGNSYQIQAEESEPQDDETATSQGQIALKAERVAQVGDFNADALSKKYGQVRFERGQGKYAFDDGKEAWYQKSVKLDRFYKPFAKDYIAPWKLIPEGETDVVTARYEGKKSIDVSKLVFTSDAKSPALPASYDETSRTWSIKLPSVASGAAYDVFAVYEGEVLGKLHVVSYVKQQHKVTLVPINNVKLDKTQIERELNAVYTPVGIHFDVEVDERMRGDYSWEVTSEQDKLLSLVGKSFWGYDKEVKESTEMLRLQQAYQAKAGTLEGAYLFVLDGAKGIEGQKGSLLGEMPRKSRFGYIFAANSLNTEEFVRTIAHEVGHGIFTLQHTFDAEYGKGTQNTTNNLLDYAKGTSLAAFQWNIMANPAIFTATDKAEEGRIESYKSHIVCIPIEISNAILSSQNSVLAPDGRRMKLPKDAIITALFFGDTSEHPAPEGSIAKFQVRQKVYKTWYIVKDGNFASYNYQKDSKTNYKIESSQAPPVSIKIDAQHHRVVVNGVNFEVDAANFDCGEKPLQMIDPISFRIRPTTEQILVKTNKEDNLISDDQDVINALVGAYNKMSNHETSITPNELEKKLSDKLEYKGPGLSSGRRFIILSSLLTKGSSDPRDWNTLAHNVFRKLGLGEKDVLVILPFAHYKTKFNHFVTLYMPGFACGESAVIDRNRLKETYDISDGSVGKTGQGMGDYALDIFTMTEIPTIKPQVLIQTVTKPGYGVKEDRYEYEFEDANGRGLTPPSTIVAEDMRYGSSFNLSTINDDRVRENLERLSKKTDDELFKKLINLAEWVSRGELEDNNKRMIAEWRQQKYKTPEEYYIDSRLTDAVFKNQDFTTIIKYIIRESIKNAKGRIETLVIKEEDISGLRRPTFPLSKDKGKGLTFALNDIWGFRVTLLGYRFDVTKRHFWAKTRIDIFDHFGLDKSDVEKFGSLENVRDKAAPWGEILSEATRPRDDQGAALTEYGASDVLFEEAAEGFCSWFILQYMRGYKPFVTMMSKEIILQGQLK